MQITSRTSPADLSGQISALRTSAPTLPHPLLEAAADSHADFLTQINESGSVLHRTVLVTAREPDPQHAPRAAQRISDAAAMLAGCEIDAAPLNTTGIHRVLNAALDPDTHAPIGA